MSGLIRRDELEDAALCANSIEKELLVGLTEKGFVSATYLWEKLDKLTVVIRRITGEDKSGAVEPGVPPLNYGEPK